MTIRVHIVDKLRTMNQGPILRPSPTVLQQEFLHALGPRNFAIRTPTVPPLLWAVFQRTDCGLIRLVQWSPAQVILDPLVVQYLEQRCAAGCSLNDDKCNLLRPDGIMIRPDQSGCPNEVYLDHVCAIRWCQSEPCHHQRPIVVLYTHCKLPMKSYALLPLTVELSYALQSQRLHCFSLKIQRL